MPSVAYPIPDFEDLGGVPMCANKDILLFDKNDYVIEEREFRGEKLLYRVYRDRQYVRKPVDKAYQSLDLYEPLLYGNKMINAVKTPILLLNRCGGYMSYSNRGPGRKPPRRPPRYVNPDAPRIGPAPGVEGRGRPEREDALCAALAEGFVVVIPGNRGRDCCSAEGVYFGKAPAMIVDLKAAVRYLRYNSERIPGDTEKIISRGASAGGGMSALLGVSGNDPDYEPHLKALGAAEARDDVFAAVCMSPVLDLEHQNCSYEWQYGKLPVNGFENVIQPPVDQKISSELAAEFEDYMRSLALRCRGNYGILSPENYKDYYLNEFLIPAAEKWFAAQDEETLKLYLEDRPWISWDGKNVSFSFEDYETYLGRLKQLAPFDSFILGMSENTAFGTEFEPAAHYTEYVHRAVLGDPNAKLPKHIIEQRELLNPVFRMQKGKGKAARHWWLRLGAKEMGFACPLVVCFASMLENRFDDVDFRLIWDGGHCSEDDFELQLKWVRQKTGYCE